jgi:hypothetical protein
MTVRDAMAGSQQVHQATTRPMAVVMLEQPWKVAPSALATAIRSRHPDLAVEVCNPAAASGAEPIAPLLRCGGELVSVLSLPGAVLPFADDPTWLRASAIWPKDRTDVRHHGHVMVVPVGTAPRLQMARIVSAVAGALTAVAPGVRGVAWDGCIARPPEAWITDTRTAFAPFPGYPWGLWVDIVPFRSHGSVGAVTMGLSAFAGREIELETDPGSLPDMLHKISGLSIYMIEHGLVVRDGHTIGGSETERLQVRHVDSARFSGLPVLYARVPGSGGASSSDRLAARLPTDQQAASCVRPPPDNGGVIEPYMGGIRRFFDAASQSLAGQEGNAEAVSKLAVKLNELQDVMREALATGKLFSCYPKTAT